MDNQHRPITIVQYTADLWQHVCPVLRTVGPAQVAGWPLIHGNEWSNGEMIVYPERVQEADIVLIQRDFPRYTDIYNEVIAQARAQGKPIVYEIDDMLTELPKTHPDYERYTSVRADILRAIVQADAVTCSTPALGNYLRDFNSRVWVIPNYLNDYLWDIRPFADRGDRTKGRPIIIGYLGAHSHQPDLEIVIPVLERILDRYEDEVLLRFWGIAPPRCLYGRRNVEWLDPALVDYAAFASYFIGQECDVFFAPLVDNPFNRCKSPIKFLEYSALGVPGVFSHLPPYASVVNHGENGFLADTLEEWEKGLTQLIEDPQLRQQMGEAAQNTLRKGWLLSDHIQIWKDAFISILASSVDLRSPKPYLSVTEKFWQWSNEDRMVIRAQEEKINLLVNEFAAKEKIIQMQAAQLAEKEELLTAIHHSTGWILLEALYKVRLRLIPRDSRRERWMRFLFQALRVLKNEGVRSLIKRLARLTREDITGPFTDTVYTQLIAPNQSSFGGCYPDPSISLLLIQREDSLSSLEVDVIRNWYKTQTLQPNEVVIWQQKEKIAQDLISDTIWKANDLHSLVQGLKGRYLCMISPDLLQQSPTYLEANLVALESETLLFTVNALGEANWVIQFLGLKRLPGDTYHPLFRIVVRKEFITNDFSIDLDAWLKEMGGKSRVVGKIIRHTSSVIEQGSKFPLETHLLGDAEVILKGNSVLARVRGDSPWSQPPHAIRDIAQVMPLRKDLSKRPTVIVAQTFLAIGGAERIAISMMEGLRNEFRFIVVTLEEHNPALGTTVDAYCHVTPYVYTMPEYVLPPLYYSFLEYLIERFEPQTFYIANGASWLYDNIVRLKQQYPHLRLVNQVYDHQAGWINRYDLGVVLNIDAHIASNRKIYDAYLRLGVHPTRIYLIENGVNGQKFDPSDYPENRRRMIKENLGVPPDKKIITFISRFHPQKRPLDFVELARRFISRPSFHFLMVGDGPLASVVEEKIYSLGLENLTRVRFYNPSSDIFAISDVIVLPSEYEGMPMVILEAQVMGKPVVVTDVGNNREVLETTKGGIVIPRIGDIAALKAGVEQVLGNPPDPEQLRKAVLARYSIEEMCANYRRALMGE